MNYKIITDESALIEFIDWLPILQDNEKYYLSLFARKKYVPELIKSNDKTQLKRFTSDRYKLIDKLRQLEIKLGRWILRDVPAPQESLVVYITPNPRCMRKATELMGKKCWDLIHNKNYNIHAEALSCIQKSKARTVFVDFDIDDKSVDVDIEWLIYILGKDSFAVIETRGGYHILIRPKFATIHYNTMFNSKNWYSRIIEKYPVDQSGDQMLPIVGTYQGGFTPKFIYKG